MLNKIEVSSTNKVDILNGFSISMMRKPLFINGNYGKNILDKDYGKSNLLKYSSQ